MRRSAPIVAMAVLVGCGPEEPEIAYIEQFDRVAVLLDGDRPSRTWDIRVETNVEAARSGLTWTTVGVGVTMIVEAFDPWTDQYVDASLTGDEVESAELLCTQEGLPSQTLLRERYQADCVAGEACQWSYLLEVSRRQGSRAEIALDLEIRALVTLGTEDEASDAAQMTVEAYEIVEE